MIANTVRGGLLIAVLLVRASAATNDNGWLKVQSPYFTVVGNIDEIQMKDIADGAENFLRAMSARLPFGLTIVVFKDDASYDPFRPAHDVGENHTVGYFLPDSEANFIVIAAGARTRETLYHELFHAIARGFDRPLAVWENEGLAEFHSTFDTGIGSVIAAHVETLRTEPWIPMADLLTLQKGPTPNIFHAQSWALAHYLRAGGELSNPNIESVLRRYVETVLTANKVPVKAEPLRVNKREVSAISEAEAMTHQGNLLMQLDRLNLAEQHLRTAMRLEPSFPGTFTAMGFLKLRQSAPLDAIPFLRRAVEEDSANHLAHFYYAAALQAIAQDSGSVRRSRLELSREHLRRAISIAPAFTPSYTWLGHVVLSLEEGYDEVERILVDAIEREPRDEGLRSTLSTVRRAFEARRVRDAERRERDSRELLARRIDQLRVKPPLPAVTPPVVVAAMPKSTPSRPPVYPTMNGLLTMIDCRDGLTLVLRAADRIVRFQTRTPIQLEFFSKVSNAANESACGWVRPEAQVVVTYRPVKNQSYLGVPIRIEYK